MVSLMEKLFLKAVVAEFRRSGLEEATFEDVSWLTLPSHCCGCARVMHMLVKLGFSASSDLRKEWFSVSQLVQT